ncbi:MAG TPA: hypothetical protein VHX60_00295 [Acidobacteriaceae bacterium]|nr:hypothetical protein [Acidobacteriaceae bacterium]
MQSRWKFAPALFAALLATSPLLFAQAESQGQGQAVVTVLPKNDKQPDATVATQSISLSVNGKQTPVTNWQPLRGSQFGVELVLLIDGGARTSLGRELEEIQHFVQSLPPNVKIAIAYMENGRAYFSGPLTTDHAKALQALHIPGGEPGISASPYFCLSSLAKNWPSNERDQRREVIMITDGVDSYERQYDPEDPYVQTAINDAVRARLTVYSIYWTSNGRADRGAYENNAGQSLLLLVDEATGGTNFWGGMGNPVTLAPYFDEFSRRLNNQYELQFTANLKGKPQIETLKVKTSQSGFKVDAPQKVLVAPQGSSPE